MDLIGCGVDIGMFVEVGGVCLLRKGGVMGSVECVDESWRMRLFMNVSSAPVSRYFRWDLESSSACFWVCVRVGMRPWYMVARLMRSMCIPHVHPSFCLGYFVCGYLVRCHVGGGVLLLIPCTIGVGWCGSC